MWPFLVSTLRARAEEPSAKVPPPSWGVANLQATCTPLGRLGVVRFSGLVAVMFDPNTVEWLVGSHSLHLWHRPKSQNGTGTGLGEAGWGLILGRGCFLIRELQQMLLTMSTCAFGKETGLPHPSGGLTSGILAVPGCRVTLGACSLTGISPVIYQHAHILDTTKGSALSAAVQLGTQLSHLHPSAGMGTQA